MQVSKSVSLASKTVHATYDEPTVCPLCKYALKPQELSFTPYKNDENEWFLCATYLCKHCYQAFLTLYRRANHEASTNYLAEPVYTGPTKFKEETFDTALSELSPQFVKIYNQALAAESSGLSEISGIGYRKALEFLVKDYLIHENPDDAETVKRMELGNCIANKVSNARLKAVASRSAWLGNDQTHYVQRFADRDIEDMKSFIRATVYWISMELITEDALGMQKADR